MTTFRRRNFLKANPVGIRAGSEEQKGFSRGSHATVSSSSTHASTFSRFSLVGNDKDMMK